MKVYYNTQFLDTGNAINLISIGLAADDGRTYYAVNSEAPWDAISANKWLCENVVPQLPLVSPIVPPPAGAPTRYNFTIDRTNTLVRPHWVIANEVRAFIQGVEEPELWAYYPSHDYVALTQLWGPLMNAPAGIPDRPNDLQQEIERLQKGGSVVELPAKPANEHHALADAKWNKSVGDYLVGAFG
jgi:hypothetical protein